MMAGKVISANMRRMDVAARYGGDEFVLLLPHAGGTEAAQVAQRIREEFKQAAAALLKKPAVVSMSVGIGSLSQNKPAGGDQLIGAADAALYLAKESGRDRVIANSNIAMPAQHAAGLSSMNRRSLGRCPHFSESSGRQPGSSITQRSRYGRYRGHWSFRGECG